MEAKMKASGVKEELGSLEVKTGKSLSGQEKFCKDVKDNFDEIKLFQR